MFQAGIAVALLWLNKKRNQYDNLLITLIACIGVHLFAKWVIYAMVDDKDVKLAMNTFIQLAYGPLIYLYVRKLKTGFIPLTYLFLFLPLFIATVAYFSVISSLFVNPVIGHAHLQIYNNWTSYFIVIGNGVYAVITSYLLKKWKKNIPFAEYKLIGSICAIFIFLNGLSIICMAIESNATYLLALRYVAYSLFMVICFLVVRHKYVGTNPPEIVADDEQKSVSDRKPILSSEQLADFADILNTYMRKTKAYLDIDFNMDKLSEDTNISRRYISETLNTYFFKSFYRYINEYRIEEFILELNKRIESDVEINLLSIAYQSGFKTKSSFNLYFKKIVGTTPTDYVKKNQDSLKKSAIQPFVFRLL
ncbi:AraC-type DNA-binding protein [Olivibacter domesticus]|uniref:AraC-type DNA-binding protein n=2 Tax=Olivibacter domesticus TaxID=407022 RepID=A0A1H7Y744_OLID1|nr:AraC-type DNA-binding protein [Olivibacter domesticus]